MTKNYIVRSFYSPDGTEGGTFAVGKEVSKDFVKNLAEFGADLKEDRALEWYNNEKYGFFQLYLKNGSFVLLQDLDYENDGSENDREDDWED